MDDLFGEEDNFKGANLFKEATTPMELSSLTDEQIYLNEMKEVSDLIQHLQAKVRQPEVVDLEEENQTIINTDPIIEEEKPEEEVEKGEKKRVHKKSKPSPKEDWSWKSKSDFKEMQVDPESGKITAEESNSLRIQYDIVNAYARPMQAIEEYFKKFSKTTFINIVSNAEKNFDTDFLAKLKTNLKLDIKAGDVSNLVKTGIRFLFMITQKKGIAGIAILFDRFSKKTIKGIPELDIPKWEDLSKLIDKSRIAIEKWESGFITKNTKILSSIHPASEYLKAILAEAHLCFHVSYETIYNFKSNENWVCAVTCDKIVNGETVYIIQMVLHGENGSSNVRHFYVKQKKGDNNLFYVNSIMAYIYAMAFPKVKLSS